MHDDIQLMIATSTSMIITFVIDSTMKYTPSTQSFLQRYFIDIWRDFSLAARCMFNEGIEGETYRYYLSYTDLFCLLLYILFGYLMMLAAYNYPKLTDHVSNIIHTLLVVEFLSKYISSFNFSVNIDTLTVYFIVYQLSCLGLNWKRSNLLPPILIIEHGSLCVMTALESWMHYFICFRYLPLTSVLLLFWAFSINDIFICLHYRGFIYDGDSKDEKSIEKNKCLPNVYYTKGMDKWKNSSYLGVADFLIYNILVLIVLPLSLSTMINIYITIGTIVSVQIGYLLTSYLGALVDCLRQPAVPLPVITVSIYLFILDIIFSYNSDQCIQFK